MSMEQKRKIAVTAVAGILLMMLYMTIFSFSSQDGDESGQLSLLVSRQCVEAVNVLTRRHWTAQVKSVLASAIEHPLRKLAHFSEYTLMGLIVYTLWRQWLPRGKKLYFLTVGWVFASAMLDEFHQFFVSGRDGNIWDVLLDTCGGCFALLICLLIEKWHRSAVKKKGRRPPTV